MNTATQLAAVAVLALSGLGLYMVADGGPATDPAPPAAVTDLDPVEVVAKVTGSAPGSFGPDGTFEIGQYAFLNRHTTATGTVTADDPRLAGQFEVVLDWDDFLPDQGTGAMTNSFKIHFENEGGAWDGVAKGITYPGEELGTSRTSGLLTGSGSYEGQSAYLLWEAVDHYYTFEGLIFPGDMLE